jgi:cell division protein FtsW (lipid II flippase)
MMCHTIFADIAANAEAATQTGVGLGTIFGSMIAVVCSWERNRSILWAIIAGILSWLYVIYFFFTRRIEEGPKRWFRE